MDEKNRVEIEISEPTVAKPKEKPTAQSSQKLCAEAERGQAEEAQNDDIRSEEDIAAAQESTPAAEGESLDKKTSGKGIKAFFARLFKKREKKPRRKWSRKKKIIVFSVLGVLAAALIVGLVYVNTILTNPKSAFDQAKPAATPSKPVESEVAEMSEYDKLLSEADLSMMDGIINVALVGVDHAEERDAEEWNGKHDFHADVILILAVNFNDKTVDMISIPRDTYANIPDVKGIYKINASLDIGGGMEAADGAGFKKVCETASWMLGGINIDYYVGVDMNAVKDLGNAIGGVDFDLEQDFNLGGRYYKKGYQHMDGQGILDYMRVRKAGNIASSQIGDQKRVDRQKKMMLAVFETLKKNDLLPALGNMMTAFDGNLYTNMNLSQIASMAVFAYDLDSQNIAMHSMGGTGGKIGEWNFVFTNQKNRVEIIKEVYGVDAERYTKYTADAAFRKYMQISGSYTENVATKALKTLKAMLPPEEAEETPEATATPKATKTPKPTATPEQEASATPAPTPTPAPSAAASSGTTGCGMALTAASSSTVSKEWELYEEAEEALEEFVKNSTRENFNALQSAVVSLAKKLGYNEKKINWYYPYDTKYNEIYVDFR